MPSPCWVSLSGPRAGEHLGGTHIPTTRHPTSNPSELWYKTNEDRLSALKKKKSSGWINPGREHPEVPARLPGVPKLPGARRHGGPVGCRRQQRAMLLQHHVPHHVPCPSQPRLPPRPGRLSEGPNLFLLQSWHREGKKKKIEPNPPHLSICSHARNIVQRRTKASLKIEAPGPGLPVAV